MTSIEAQLAATPSGTFGDSEVAGLPPIVQQHLTQSIRPGAPLATAVRLTMRGQLKVRRWVPFTATEVLAPHRGFVWHVRVGPGVITGTDRYVDGTGEVRMRLLGLRTIVHATGPDVARSAAARAGGESLWVPTALLPRFGARWEQTGAHSATVRFDVDDTPLAIDYELDEQGRVRSGSFDRWGDPDGDGRWGWHRCGGDVGSYETFGDLTIPASGNLGWHHGTDRWPDGEFFRYEITSLEPATPA